MTKTTRYEKKHNNINFGSLLTAKGKILHNREQQKEKGKDKSIAVLLSLPFLYLLTLIVFSAF